MKTSYDHCIVFEPKPQGVRKLSQVCPAHVPDNFSVGLGMPADTVDGLCYTIQKLIAQPSGLRFIPIGGLRYVGCGGPC